LAASPATTAPVVTIAPAAGAAVVEVPHDGPPLTAGDAELAAADEAPVVPLTAVPAAAPPVDPPGQGGATGAATGVGVGITGADVGGELVGVVVTPADGAPAVVVAVVADPVVAGGTAGGGGVAVGVVATGAGAGAGDGVGEPVEVWAAPDVAVVNVVAPDPAGAVVLVAVPTAAVADAATQRQASSTDTPLRITPRTCFPNPSAKAGLLGYTRWRVTSSQPYGLSPRVTMSGSVAGREPHNKSGGSQPYQASRR
jgi:hypothetical protein